MKKLVLFGAGKIGRSFIGQLFSASKYEVVFIDINEKIIKELNKQKQYKVVIKSNTADEVLHVENVRGVLGTQKEQIIAELISCDLAAVSVGQRGLSTIIPILAEVVRMRQIAGQLPLDIIIAENMRNADEYIRTGLLSHLNNDFPIDDWVGLVETSIGKMVPILPEEEIEKDPLIVFAESYNTLILDKKGFKNSIPQVTGLAPKDNIKAWVDRKSYIHNFGHAAAAYAGYVYNPSQIYISDVLSNLTIKKFTIKAMEQSAAILKEKYPSEFTWKDLSAHIHNLIDRFENKALKDTVFRVGCDLQRKLHKDDRILSPLIEGLEMGLPVDYIMMVFSFGLCFKASDRNGKLFTKDSDFFEILKDKGLGHVFSQIIELDTRKLLDTIFL